MLAERCPRCACPLPLSNPLASSPAVEGGNWNLKSAHSCVDPQAVTLTWEADEPPASFDRSSVDAALSRFGSSPELADYRRLIKDERRLADEIDQAKAAVPRLGEQLCCRLAAGADDQAIDQVEAELEAVRKILPRLEGRLNAMQMALAGSRDDLEAKFTAIRQATVDATQRAAGQRFDELLGKLNAAVVELLPDLAAARSHVEQAKWAFPVFEQVCPPMARRVPAVAVAPQYDQPGTNPTVPIGSVLDAMAAVLPGR